MLRVPTQKKIFSLPNNNFKDFSRSSGKWSTYFVLICWRTVIFIFSRPALLSGHFVYIDTKQQLGRNWSPIISKFNSYIFFSWLKWISIFSRTVWSHISSCYAFLFCSVLKIDIFWFWNFSIVCCTKKHNN